MPEGLTIAGLPVTNVKDLPVRSSKIIWGNIGSGKTPLAATAEAPILFLMYDHGGVDSIRHVGDRFDIVDCSAEEPRLLEAFLRRDQSGCDDLDSLLATGKYKTLVLDSLTSVMDSALILGIAKANIGVKTGEASTIWNPGLRGYGARLTATRMVVMNLHALCARHNVNFILTAHVRQREEKLDKDTIRVMSTMAISGEAYVSTPKNFSEIWCLREEGDERYIQVRSKGTFSPCRTRMFRVEGTEFRFPWKFNPYTWEGEGIEKWMKRWEANEQKPIKLPK